MTECMSDEPKHRPSFEELDLQQLKWLDASAMEPTCQDSPKAALKKDRANDLLFEVFPRHAAEALRDGRKVEAQSREIVTVFFSDIIGFTTISSTLTLLKVSDMLGRLYSRFDELSRLHGVHKMETIGDAYMAVTNFSRTNLIM
jgi:class 3 adenylate cyclase